MFGRLGFGIASDCNSAMHRGEGMIADGNRVLSIGFGFQANSQRCLTAGDCAGIFAFWFTVQVSLISADRYGLLPAGKASLAVRDRLSTGRIIVFATCETIL